MLKIPMNEIASRIVALQFLLVKNGVDAAIIRQNADLYYFTGTVQDGHLVVPASGQPVFLVKRDVVRAEEQSPLRPVVPLKSLKDLAPAVFDACGGASPGKIGLELDVLPANIFFYYDEKIFPRQQVVDVSGWIRQVRMIKSPWEIEMMRKAEAISRQVADAVPGLLREGMTELELSIELESVARRAGHLGMLRFRAFNMEMYFGHILSGAEAAVSSYIDAPTGGEGPSPAFGQGSSEKKIRAGEIVSVDIMVNYHGYLNDQTRNYCIGPPPPELRDAYGFVREIHGRFKKLARPGTVTGELYEEVWQWVKETRWADFFMGSGDTRVSFIGHGLGLEVDEFPFIAQGHKVVLQEGMTLAFEPKFIIPGVGITGLENTYLVTAMGLESLNTAGEELMIL
ncbi:peptidase M24 [Desulforhabdus amnigena]|uniref:Peptidase M24 n=2 Tax=Desulforhabdus amnigena TaxID=40218 RepID=A0A9W6FX46_9BACT|nr:peptidase M24 [Desulforhabdus amnigena]